MLAKLILLTLASSTLAVLNNHQFSLPVDYNLFGKNFTSLKQAIKDADNFIYTEFSNYNLPSLMFGIAHKGKLIHSISVGHTDLENKVLIRPESKYRLCSISKTFASALVAKLVAEGKLKYDTPISKILSEKDFPKKQWHGQNVEITVADLLTHRAGLHVTVFEDFNNVILTKNTTEMIHKFKDQPLISKPGTTFAYSNYGYQVLAAVIEAVTKQTYEHHLTEFLIKHNLNDTVLDQRKRSINHRSRYYRYLPSNDIKVNLPTYVFDELFFAEEWWAAGGLLSTVNDLLHYGQMMVDAYKGRDGAILPSSIVKEMWKHQVHQAFPSTQGDVGYGYGWIPVNITNPGVYTVKHRNFVFHSGGLVGTSTMLLIYPEEEVVGVAFTNKGYVGGLDQLVIYTMENIYDFLQK